MQRLTLTPIGTAKRTTAGGAAPVAYFSVDAFAASTRSFISTMSCI